MSRVPTSREEIDASNRYGVYRKGWRDGVYARMRPTEIANHPDDELRAAYDRGYYDGATAYSEAMRKAQQIFDYEPSPLRA